LLPILRLTFPAFQAVAIIASYLAEGIAKVISVILGGAGWLLRGIGKLLNLLPGSIGNPLIRAGEALARTADSFGTAASEMAKKRREIEAMSFDDALDRTTGRLNELSEAALNAVQGFKLERFRFAAQDARAAAAPAAFRAAAPPSAGNRSTGQAQPVAVNYDGATFNFNISADGDPREVAREVVKVFQQLARAKPLMRPWVATLG
jgi:hypothetical protein